MLTTASPKHAPTLPPTAELDRRLAELDEHGFTILPGFLDRETTKRLRDHTDAVIGTTPPNVDAHQSVISTLRHPIPGDIMAEMVTEQHLELANKILQANELRLIEQVLLRTDTAKVLDPSPCGWHIDMAFHPKHYTARPQQTYVHMVHMLSKVERGGGATMVVPGSQHQHYAAAKQFADQRGGAFDMLDQKTIKEEILRIANVDKTKAVEIPASEGDLVMFNPMCLHAGSRNTLKQSRYVMFMQFMDVAATELNAVLNNMKWRDGFPDSLRNGLPPQWRSLLNR